jgi:8-oxo-dGTP diphosphatase
MNYVVAFLFSEDAKLIALITKDHPDWQKGKLNGIGGHIEAFETPTAAIIREIEEEAGVSLKSLHLFAIGNTENNSTTLYCFTAKINVYDITSKEKERINLYRVNGFNERPIIDNLKWLIPLALDNTTIITNFIFKTPEGE